MNQHSCLYVVLSLCCFQVRRLFYLLLAHSFAAIAGASTHAPLENVDGANSFAMSSRESINQFYSLLFAKPGNRLHPYCLYVQ